MFYNGSLQEGIALAVQEAKAVICFVRDDTQTSSEWEDDYFADEELAQLLKAKSVLLRLSAGSQEAGFLTSFCPIPKFPAVVVIKNGMLQEYLVPDISKDDFRSRLTAILQGKPFIPAAPTAPASQQLSATRDTQPETPRTPPTAETRDMGSVRAGKQRVESVEGSKQDGILENSASSMMQKKDERAPTVTPAKQNNLAKKQPKEAKPTPKTPQTNVQKPPKEEEEEEEEVRRPAAPTPPKQFRLQVRLFDGSSVRSSFSPSQTIRGHVRPWLDGQMADNPRPFNLKHILTPLPNRALTIADEEQTLQELGLGPTASLVMVPISSYTEAYAGSGSSLPVRGAYAAYGLVSSAVGMVTGMVGSFLGYGGQGQSAPSETVPVPQSPSNSGAQRTRPAPSRGANIRTLRDQSEGRDDHQFYNGNQLNFEPRQNGDGKFD